MLGNFFLSTQATDGKWASQVAQLVKKPPAMQETQETWVRSLGWGDSLEKEMATHSNWKIPWTDECGKLQSMGVTKNQTLLSMLTHPHTSHRWQGGYSLQDRTF